MKVIGTIDLSFLNLRERPRKMTRQQKEKLREKKLEHFHNDLFSLYGDDFHYRTRGYCQSHSLLHSIVPVLQENIRNPHLCPELLIEIAFLIVDYGYSVNLIIEHLDSFWEYYIINGDKGLERQDIELLESLVYLLEQCELYGTGYEEAINALKQDPLLMKIDLKDIVCGAIGISDAFFERRIHEYFTNEYVSWLLKPFCSLYLRNFSQDRPYETLYRELCVKGAIRDVMTNTEKMSRAVVIRNKKLPLVICFIIAFDKITASGVIHDDWICRNVGQSYISAFREFWWACSVYGLYKSKYSDELDPALDLEDLVVKILDFVEIETGKKIEMDNDYLQKELVKTHEDTGTMQTETRETKGGTSTKEKSYSSTSLEKSFVSLIIRQEEHTVEEILKELHRHIDGQKEYKYIGCVLYRAREDNLIMQIPSEEIFLSEFPEHKGHWESIRVYTNSDSTNSKRNNTILEVSSRIVLFGNSRVNR